MTIIFGDREEKAIKTIPVLRDIASQSAGRQLPEKDFCLYGKNAVFSEQEYYQFIEKVELHYGLINRQEIYKPRTLRKLANFLGYTPNIEVDEDILEKREQSEIEDFLREGLNLAFG